MSSTDLLQDQKPATGPLSKGCFMAGYYPKKTCFYIAQIVKVNTFGKPFYGKPDCLIAFQLLSKGDFCGKLIKEKYREDLSMNSHLRMDIEEILGQKLSSKTFDLLGIVRRCVIVKLQYTSNMLGDEIWIRKVHNLSKSFDDVKLQERLLDQEYGLPCLNGCEPSSGTCAYLCPILRKCEELGKKKEESKS
jgi:hypothetical protein